MAYGDYQDQTFNQNIAKLYPGGSAGFDESAYARPAGPYAPMPTPAPSTPVAPDSNNNLPTNTRQQNLQQVQQAYAQPTRMPGDMGFLNDLLSQSSQAPSANDPLMRNVFAAGRVADQRTFDRQRAALAEQLGARGLGSSGALDTGVNKFRQQIGENQAARESGMLYDEGNARRNALLQALGLDQSRYTADQGYGIDLARLEAALNGQAVQPFLSY